MSTSSADTPNPIRSSNPGPDRGRIIRAATVAAVLVAGGGALMLGLPSDAANPEPALREALPKQVVVAEATPAEATRSRRYAGSLESNRHASLSFTIAGRVVERKVDVGDHVDKGDVLAILDRRPFRNQLSSARATQKELTARRSQARRDHERMERLVKAESIPEAQAERTETDLQAIRASELAANTGVSEASRLLGEAVLRAPFTGTVTSVGLEPGEYATPGRAAVELTGDGALELEVELPETAVTALEPETAVDVVFPLLNDRRVTGRVQAMAQGARGPGRLFPVRVEIPPAPGLLPGMTAELQLETQVRASLSVPVDAVINPGGERPSVFVVKDGVVERTQVEVVDVLDGRAFVEAELEAGDQVVVGGHAGLASGVKVEVRS